MSTQNLKGNATEFVDIDNSREDDQRGVMQQIVDQKHCPFCMENLFEYHKKPVLFDGEFWILTANQWPYKNTKNHFLIIAKEHIESFIGISSKAAQEFFEILSWVEKEYKLPGGAIGMRFGDTIYSAGTVKHLHAQFIVPDVDKKDFKPVRFKIGKEKEDIL